VCGPKARVAIGDDVSIGFGAAIAAYHYIEIGDRVQIGPFAMIMDTDFHKQGEIDGAIPEGDDIVIGDDVQIGSRVTILKGTSIGNGARIESGSVVSGVVPNNAEVSGVPGRIRSPEPLQNRVTPNGRGPFTTSIESLRERVLSVIATTLGVSGQPQLMSTPDEIDGWDSIGVLKLIVALEDEFGTRLMDDDITGIRTVGDLITIIERLASDRSSGPRH
jgi:acyl carrier protein